MGDIVREKICKEVQNAVFFSVLVDETKDIGKQEQLAIVLRYVNAPTASICERFLTYIKAESLNAESLTKYILDTLDEYNINVSGLVSQGYDGASVMSGKVSGVQARIQNVVPTALYIHCNAHCLNLCLVDSVKAVGYAGKFFALLETLYVFLSSSKCHVMFVRHQQAIYKDKQVRQLQRLVDTRWACRANAVATICHTYKAVVATLEEFIADSDSNKTRVCEARGLLLQVKCFQFMVSLVIFDRILSCTKSLSDALQCNNLDLAKAANLVSATIRMIQDFRSDSEWKKVFTYVEKVAEHHNLSVECEPDRMSNSRVRTLPCRLEDSVITSTTGTREQSTTSLDYKINFYYPILDAILFELKRRFDEKNQKIMIALQACHPSSSKFLDVPTMKPLIEVYKLDINKLMTEAPLAKNTLAKIEGMEEVSDVLIQLYPLKAAFPVLISLYQICLTISVTTAKCERTFSTLKRTKSYLRSTMTEQRLRDLAILSIERDISSTINFQQVVDNFSTKERKIVLL